MQTRARRTRTLAQVRLGEVITAYVNHLIRWQEQLANKDAVDTIEQANPLFPSYNFFCAEKEPDITVAKYADRLTTYMSCSGEAYIFAMAYLRRLVLTGFPLHLRSIHRVLLTAIVVAAKARDDFFYSMSFYSQIGGVSSWDLRCMELRFLTDLISFRTDISSTEYMEVILSITTAVKESGGLCAEVTEYLENGQNLASKQEQLEVYFSQGIPVPQWVLECDLSF